MGRGLKQQRYWAAAPCGLDTDRYGRIVGEVFAGADAGSEPLNLPLVSAGQAAVYCRYCSDWRYYAAQDGAWDAGLGVWARTGEQQRPWVWWHAGR